MTHPPIPTVATEKCKSEFFFSLIHSYTYVVPISPVPKYSGGLSLRKQNKKKTSGKFLKVLLFDCVRYECHQMRGLACTGPFASCLCRVKPATPATSSEGLCGQTVLSVIIIVFVVLLFGL